MPLITPTESHPPAINFCQSVVVTAADSHASSAFLSSMMIGVVSIPWSGNAISVTFTIIMQETPALQVLNQRLLTELERVFAENKTANNSSKLRSLLSAYEARVEDVRRPRLMAFAAVETASPPAASHQKGDEGVETELALQGFEADGGGDSFVAAAGDDGHVDERYFGKLNSFCGRCRERPC